MVKTRYTHQNTHPQTHIVEMIYARVFRMRIQCICCCDRKRQSWHATHCIRSIRYTVCVSYGNGLPVVVNNWRNFVAIVQSSYTAASPVSFRLNSVPSVSTMRHILFSKTFPFSMSAHDLVCLLALLMWVRCGVSFFIYLLLADTRRLKTDRIR